MSVKFRVSMASNQALRGGPPARRAPSPPPPSSPPVRSPALTAAVRRTEDLADAQAETAWKNGGPWEGSTDCVAGKNPNGSYTTCCLYPNGLGMPMRLVSPVDTSSGQRVAAVGPETPGVRCETNDARLGYKVRVDGEWHPATPIG